ncbi:SAM-dependent methyltransferase, partial [Escherichia coli]|nr:SAM-dependent methyltransferase [Escherichia coli]MCV5720092.1 SAM-dependent methyltransferase [Escherichia coli]
MQISTEVLNVLSRCRAEGNFLFLADQLDRSIYVKTNKVLEAAGGKWNRKEQAHIFTADAAERIEQIILTGSVDIPRDLFNFFPTPENLVTDMVL